MPDTERAGLNPLTSLLEDVPELIKGGQIRIRTGDLLEYSDPRFAQTLEVAKLTKWAVVRIITGPILVEDDAGFNGILYLRARGKIDELLISPSLGADSYYHLIETEKGIRFYEEQVADFSTPLEGRRMEPNPDQIRLGVLSATASLAPRAFPQHPPSSAAEFRLRTFENEAKIIREYETKTRGRERLPFVTTRDGLVELMARVGYTNLGTISFLNPDDLLRFGRDLLRPAA